MITGLIPWLLLTSPGYQQPWFWLCMTNALTGPFPTSGTISTSRNVAVSKNDRSCKYIFMFSQKTRQELKKKVTHTHTCKSLLINDWAVFKMRIFLTATGSTADMNDEKTRHSTMVRDKPLMMLASQNANSRGPAMVTVMLSDNYMAEQYTPQNTPKVCAWRGWVFGWFYP